MRNIIVGTAGHIDHGKTALVRALTGTDTDRLEEEKRRGISIDLGFAHLLIPPGLKLGFVDVPGHERFVKNMLAGAGGIDLVMLVIAADESIKPQTREHFDICRLLGIEKGLVVLTKQDRVDEDLLALARMEAEEFVAGSFLEGAPIVPVSAVTGAGLPELKTALAAAARQVRQRSATGHFRLPVDRAFAMKGFGTVVTGTTHSGSIAVEDEVEVHPNGQRLRVRGIQVHGGKVDRAEAGERTALNIAGADAQELERGMVLTRPLTFQPTSKIDARLDLLPDAKPLKSGAPVHFHTGSAEIEAVVRLLGGARSLEPGGRAWARIELRIPALLLPGDRFIIRMFSPVRTIGGGVVADIAPPRYRRRQEIAPRLELLTGGSPPEQVDLLVGESSFGLSLSAVVARTGMLPAEVTAAATKASGVTVLEQPQVWLWPFRKGQELVQRIENLLRRFHKEKPLELGMAKEEVRSRILPEAPAFLLDHVLATGPFATDASTVRLKSHQLRLQQDEQKAREQIEGAFKDAGLTVPPVQEVLAASGVDAKTARTLLQMLMKEKAVVRVNDDLYFHRDEIEKLVGLLKPHQGAPFGVTEFKEWTGLSRKYAIPLLEFLDRERVTRRTGEQRVVL